MAEKDFGIIYETLKTIMSKHTAGLIVKHDEPDLYYVIGPAPDYRGNEAYFGGVQIKKNYVSYHLMPVYMDPRLLENIPESLKKRMQGKSCFNFKKEDPALFQALDQLTAQCAAWFKENIETWKY
jgi:hypothetical protein